MEPPFEKLDGVISTVVGYTGGSVKDPTYERVSSGSTGHAEAIQVVYDPSRIAYGKLLDVFWHNIDPLTANAQFCDHGNQYRSAIFYHDDAQRAAAYLQLPNVQCIGGSWLTPADALKQGDWARVEQLAREAVATLAG